MAGFVTEILKVSMFNKLLSKGADFIQLVGSNVCHWCSYNRPYWNWGGTDDHTTLQNKILVTQIFFVFR